MRVDRYLSPDQTRWLFRAVFQAGGKRQTSEGHISEAAAVRAGMEKMNEIHIQRRAEKKARAAQEKEKGILVWDCARIPGLRDAGKKLSVFRRRMREKESGQLYDRITRLVVLEKIRASRDELCQVIYRRFAEGEYYAIELESINSKEIQGFWEITISVEGGKKIVRVDIPQDMQRGWELLHEKYRYKDSLKRTERFLHCLAFWCHQTEKAKGSEIETEKQPSKRQQNQMETAKREGEIPEPRKQRGVRIHEETAFMLKLLRDGRPDAVIKKRAIAKFRNTKWEGQSEQELKDTASDKLDNAKAYARRKRREIILARVKSEK